MTTNLINGLEVTLGGHPFTMPSLNAAAARRHWDRIRAMESGTEADPMGLTLTLVTACLRRHYPLITEDEVAEHIDMDNWESLSAMVFDRGAFRRWADAQTAAQGNVPASQPSETSGTGAPSTPPLPPQPAGASPTSTP